MAEWQLYGVRGWGSVLVEGALAWTGVPYRVVDVEGFDRAGPVRDRLIAVNPLARVPTLVRPDGKVLTESAAIILWLGEQHPQAGLAPEPGSADRQEFLIRLIWFVSVLYPTFTYRDYPERWAPDAADQLARNVDAFRKTLWLQFEQEADDGPFVLGQHASALDLYLAAFSHWRPRRAWLAEHCPKLHRIALRADALPQIRDVLARNFG